MKRTTMLVTALPEFAAPAVQTYTEKVGSIDASNLIGYWPMDEASGTTADDKSAQANDGAYTAVTLGQTGIGDGLTCPLFDANAFNNVYSTAYNSDFNGQEFTIAFWFKVKAAGTWTDGTRRDLTMMQVDASNYIAFRKEQNAGGLVNRFRFLYSAGGTLKSVMILVRKTGWNHAAITVSKANDRMRVYINGAQLGATVTGLGTWAGNLSSTANVIGATNTTPSQPWSGYLAHSSVWKTELTAAQIANHASLTPASVALDSIPNHAVCITFDDALAAVYTEAFPYMQTAGVKGTVYTISGRVGTAGYCSAAQLQEMYAAGWDVANHSDNDDVLTGISQAAAQTKLATCKTYLDGQGWTRASKHVAYPTGARDATVDAAMAAEGMLTGRLASGTTSIAAALIPKYSIATRVLGNTTTLGDATGLVNIAVDTNLGVAVFCLHNLVAVATAPTEWGIADFHTLVDYIATKGTTAITITQLYYLMGKVQDLA